MTHSARASAALRALTEADPALAALSLWCAHRDTDGPVAETCGDEIRYGPAFATLPLHEQTGLAGHHILHVALRHGARLAAMQERFGPGFDARLWQIAADAIVNEALLLAGHALPRPALTLTGLLAAVGGLAPDAGRALAEWDVDGLYLRLQAGQGGKAGDDLGRALAHAAKLGFSEDIRPVPAAGEAAQTAADWRAHLARAMAVGQAAGQGVGVFGHRLADLAPPRVPWERVLRRLLLRALLAQPRPSHRRPARSWLAMEAEARARGGPSPVFQPGLVRATPAPRLILGLDCSTSIDPARMRLFMAEINGISRRMAAELHLLAFDTEVRLALRLDPAKGAAQVSGLDLPQGGGTDFAPLIGQAGRMAASALVILTDLEGPTGPAPRLPVIWAVPQGTTATPPFGQVLHLSH